MKQFLQILIFLCVATVANAQSSLEAKMAYQMAEEKFDAKQYTEALDYLEKAETALGSTNPPMLFLKVMITNQIVTVKESTDNYRKLEKAIADFDKHKDKNALGEDKQMDVYRIKMDLDKRKNAYEKEANRTADLKKQYNEMVYRLAAEFPKTEVTVRNLIESVPSTWARPKWGSGWDTRIKDRDYERFVKWGKVSLTTSYEDTQGKLCLEEIKTHNPGEDRIKGYEVRKKIKYYDKPKNNISRDLTIDEICEVLKITPQQWSDFTSGIKPLITKDTDPYGYWVTLTLSEKDPDGKYKYFQMYIYEKTWGYSYEEMRIDIFENTL
ncbi:hypothetical protein [Empedobacter tilapiae]|uniref:Tetratricopeptide repeat protein n=1 Tax=Empedobacter tilapiae TaxID=2491114 RepID=A0A4Z1BDL7_9FLAO|nr:hypothetical protein [Empedobacter tilapiae]TGN22532.1 hypothetical protein E4J94_15925 [Empedobacter tilapiae]